MPRDTMPSADETLKDLQTAEQTWIDAQRVAMKLRLAAAPAEKTLLEAGKALNRAQGRYAAAVSNEFLWDTDSSLHPFLRGPHQSEP